MPQIGDLAPWLVLLTLLAVMVAFVSERMRIEVIALTAATFLLATGVIGVDDFLAGLADPAPFTVLCMFVLSAALERTGTIEQLGERVTRMAHLPRAAALAVLMIGVVVISAFVNNTPVVVALTPVVIAFARSRNEAPSLYLLPLSFAAVMGGTCTLIGTSTNLVVDGAARRLGLEPFSIFEITWVGVPISLVGVLFMALVGRRLLPARESLHDLLPDPKKRQFLAEVLVPLGSPLVGKTLDETALAKKLGARVIEVLRDDVPLGARAGSVPLEPGDRILLRTQASDLLELREKGDVVLGSDGAHALEPIAAHQTVLMEGIVGPNSRWVGRKVSSLNLQRRFGVTIVAIHRQNENLRGNFDETRLQFGDTLLLEGPPEAFRQLFDDQFLIGLTAPTIRPYRRDRQWIALATIAAVVVGASLEIAPITALALIGVTVVILTGCLEPEDAYQAVSWPVMVMIYGMLALGHAMEETGAARILVEGLVDLFAKLGPWGVLGIVYFATVAITEVLSNNAAGILMTPIAVAIAQQLGVDPRPFVVAVMVAASNAYATPIGYQTNTFVYAAGNYRFRDFVVVGLPLNVLIGLTAVLVIPLVWSFTGP
ncbi:putative transporter [bacterium HR40]|nr:putative transporter [bacterium HR40]